VSWGIFNLNNAKIKNKNFFRPTCDSTDVICTDIDLELLKIGDNIYFSSMGAYTIPLRTPFNGLELTKVLHFIGFSDW
jgi:ornithine decarboxylase